MPDYSWTTCRFFFLYFLLNLSYRTDTSTVAAAPVKPLIGEVSIPLAHNEFSLVPFDGSGYPQPLPPTLGDLPLYPDDDGFFSVNGPLDLTAFSRTPLAPVNQDNHSAICPLITDTPGFSCENSDITPGRHQCYLNDDAIGGYVTSLPTPFVPYPSLIVR